MFAEHLKCVLSLLSGETVCSVVLFVLFPVLKRYQLQYKRNLHALKKKQRKPRLGNTNPLQGRHKWLGGAINHDNTSIFAIPAHATQVLKITPNASGGEQTEMIGKSNPLHGNYKYLRAILGQDKMIYGVPCFAKQVIKINPSTSEITYFGSLPTGEWKWHGGAIASCGNIYGVPCNAESVLKISPSTEEVSLIGKLPKGRNKWYGALLGRDGCVYGMAYKAQGILRINPRTDNVQIIGNFEESFKWHGGTIGVDGSIYAFPSHADTVLKITPPVQCPTIDEDANHGVVLEELQLSSSCDPKTMLGKYKWGGGATDREGNIFAIPSDAQSVLRLNPRTGEVITFGHLADDHNKWQGGVLGHDGNIYCVPCDADHVLVINPYTLELTTIGQGVIPPGRDKFQGGFSCGTGEGDSMNIYCIPETSSVILKILIRTQEVVIVDSISS